MRAPAAALVGLLAVASVAHADPAAAARDDAPDGAATEAADANLEPTGHRRGLTFAFASGGGEIIGFGIKDSVASGGSGSLRLGHVATPRTVITLELCGTVALHRPAEGSPVEGNTNAQVLVGAQYYVNTSLWLHLASGVGVYQGRQVAVAGGRLGDVTLAGPAALVGFGVDLARFKYVVLGVELGTSLMINRDGVLSTTSAGLGLAFD
jgi:hypothetical protein